MTTAGLSTALLVGLGGTLGAVSRFAVDVALTGERATFVVNVLGSVALGALVAASVDGAAAAVFATGFCGAFTTFSSFAVGVAERTQKGEYAAAAGYAGAMVVTALLGVGVGTVAVTTLVG